MHEGAAFLLLLNFRAVRMPMISGCHSRQSSARLVREERQRSRHQAARGQPRSPRINRTKACIPWCAKICAKGDHCPLWHPVPEEAAQILERVQRTPCRDGKDCQRTRCHFLHPGQQGDRQRKSAKDRR
ncbi:unnamed protein product [Effrenium voratum]|nr:unnamed protein product [Effrenium voratum]